MYKTAYLLLQPISEIEYTEIFPTVSYLGAGAVLAVCKA